MPKALDEAAQHLPQSAWLNTKGAFPVLDEAAFFRVAVGIARCIFAQMWASALLNMNSPRFRFLPYPGVHGDGRIDRKCDWDLHDGWIRRGVVDLRLYSRA